MAYVIAEPCIGVKDTACVDACPVDCIHPRKDEAGFEEAAQLYIDPVSALIAERVCPFAPFLRSSLWTIFRVNGATSPRSTQTISSGREDNDACCHWDRGEHVR